MSMLPRRQWPTALETEAATIWLAPVPTATAERHAEEDQQRRHDEAAADAEHARQEADRQADAREQEHVERQLGDGKVDLHGAGYTWGWRDRAISRSA